MIDFHTHSAASDGAPSARDLLDRAAREGVRRMAITDHDTIAGYLSLPVSAIGTGIDLCVELVSVGSGRYPHCRAWFDPAPLL